MIKIYFSICFSILFILVSAQQQGKQNLILKNNLNNPTSYKANNHNSVNTLTCDTLTTITRKDTLTLYSVISSSATLSGGYVTGNNHYGDSAIATFIPVDTSLMPSGAQITGVMAVFYRYGGLGTKGTQTITLNIFIGDTISGPTTTTTTVSRVTGTVTVVDTIFVVLPPIGTATASLAAISAIAPVSNAVDSAVIPILSANYQIPYVFSFASPINVPDTGFFISLTLPTTVGDTVVLLCTRNDSLHVNYAWDYGVNGWRAYSNSKDWTLYTSLSLFPIVCYPAADIPTVTGINNQVTVYPNPANDILNVDRPGINTTTEITITDVLGNIIKHASFNEQHVILNISAFNAGIYFVTITDDENHKTTKKLIIE